MSIFDDNRFCSSLYPFKWALCLMRKKKKFADRPTHLLNPWAGNAKQHILKHGPGTHAILQVYYIFLVATLWPQLSHTYLIAAK